MVPWRASVRYRSTARSWLALELPRSRCGADGARRCIHRPWRKWAPCIACRLQSREVPCQFGRVGERIEGYRHSGKGCALMAIAGIGVEASPCAIMRVFM